jgi:uncharacterized protein (TIGR03067 family)
MRLFLILAFGLLLLTGPTAYSQQKVSSTESPGGSWRVVKALPSSDVAGLIFEQNKLTIVSNAIGKRAFRYELDAKAKPARIDVLHKDGYKCLGVYEVNGDRLTICLGPWLGDRPVDFAAKGKNVVVLTLVREQK